MSTVLASLDYLKWDALFERQKPYEVFIPTSSFRDEHSVPRSNLVFEKKFIPIQNARGLEHQFKLDTQGFQFEKHATNVANLKDRDSVLTTYVPEMEEFLKHTLGQPSGIRTLCFDIRLREAVDPTVFAKKTVNLENGFDPLLPATHPHVDQSPTGAIRRVHRHLGDEATDLLQSRVRIINIWRPLDRVTSWPLATCDARSVNQNDLVTCDIVRRRYTGETCFGLHSEGQQWFYLSDQDVDEVTLLKIYDSSDAVDAKFCLHSSFPPEADNVSPQRESLEIRLLVFTKD
ncbi:uncharacterized protein NECHADRAFT_81142 [Fusarium vanettenii 77-13-4]|uniref:Methyltransferase n=1 Tax=Fusarium vanettenii (strain ATCC MYA-4622 / CBS 123669 / FGSC 9596 / NRRL 45880 / 77-13-4) TaxID=660122 RepID=C7ZGS1_FUSV7|nr:uncharacterized protein NECHADRAFT_81142 [Fusarium vanettenii 77-13-4]EEU36873.1 hypothetical protein NECHADRAFT_81142 [Fusarium vanettenii 77-13-4]